MALFRSIRRSLIRRRTFPEPWLHLLETRVPYYCHLPESLRKELHRHLPVIMNEKLFEGCGGLQMTEEKKIVIAAYATILILGEPAGYYPSLSAILVYPEAYMAPLNEEDEAGIVTEGDEPRSGESWDSGSVVLSWSDIEKDLNQPFSGKNLIFHEFAHQLDERYGATAGLDEFGQVHAPNEWNEILAREFHKLRAAVRTGEPTLLDSYGATHPAEFFSVVTEAFFENGRRLRERKPDLYNMFRRFYHLDPAAFLPAER